MDDCLSCLKNKHFESHEDTSNFSAFHRPTVVPTVMDKSLLVTSPYKNMELHILGPKSETPLLHANAAVHFGPEILKMRKLELEEA